uniref:LRP2-binding protein n=1 Tax=Mesocestoides corti TaxID=53468 RepID=A0A5K3F0R2_MESCO
MMEGLLSLDRGVGSPKGNAEIVDAAAFNLYLAYLQGWGVKQSDEKALKYLLKSARFGQTRVSVLAQTTLGYFYASPDHFDLAEAFHWHSEACHNGSIESQGKSMRKPCHSSSLAVIGVLYMFGMGVRKDWCSALSCLREASKCGSIFAKGLLSLLYFIRQLYTNASRTAYSLAFNQDLKNEPNSGPDASTFAKRGLAVACFVYATCLDRGVGVEKDEQLAKSLYSRSIHTDPITASKLQNMLIREEF